MLEHQKMLLEKLSDDKELFRKELIKSFKWLRSYEIFNLLRWAKNRFGDTHMDVIEDVFSHSYAHTV